MEVKQERCQDVWRWGESGVSVWRKGEGGVGVWRWGEDGVGVWRRGEGGVGVWRWGEGGIRREGPDLTKRAVPDVLPAADQ